MSERQDQPVIRLRVTIEPSWTHDHHSEVIEVEAAELAGLEGMARQEKITELAGDYVNNVCSWGAMELGPDEED